QAPPEPLAVQPGEGRGEGGDAGRPVPELGAHDTVAHAVEQLRLRRASLAVVRDASGELTGLVSLDDLLGRLMEPGAV
ncbi:CBS domain-containing protein, partial [Streptomyces sp. NPDC002692]